MINNNRRKMDNRRVNSSLIAAVREGKREKVRKLINSLGLSQSQEWSQGYVLLCDALKNQHAEVAKLLLINGSTVNIKSEEPADTPLHLAVMNNIEIVKMILDKRAVMNNNMEIVKMILDKGADVDAKNEHGKTPLHVAAERGYPQIAEHLLDNGANVNCACTGGENYTPLHFAVERGHAEVVTLLLSRGANVDAKGEDSSTLLHIAAKFGSLDRCTRIVEDLLNHGADVNARHEIGNTPILCAVGKADSKITKFLLINRADIKDSLELLNTAVDNKYIEIIEALLQYGADINATDEYGRTALHFTASHECKNTFRLFPKHRDINHSGEIAKLLLSKGANVNAQTKDGVTTLHAAVEKGYAKIIEALLECNANIDCKDKNDSTPLHISARKGNEDISIMLLDKGANVNAEQKDGMTPLHLAAQEDHEEVVKVLLKRGAKVDSKMNNDVTPLHLAAEKEAPKIIEILLKFGAEIDSEDEDGRTALHIASEHGHEDAVEFLLDYGSDINITCKNNQTALDYAMDGMSSFYEDLEDNDSDHYDFDDEFDECSHKYVAEVLKCHMIKMITADLYVSEQNSQLIGSLCRIDFSPDDCKKEIERMKSQKIDNRRISFYDILTKDINSLAMYMRIEKIVEVSESKDYARDFPIYASMIKNNFRKSIQRRKLLARGSESFSLLSNNLPELPYDCTLKMMSSLSDEDLRNLIDASKPLGISNLDTNDN